MPLREPEHELEHEVRVWWIYPSDAAFLGGLFLVVAEAIWHAAEGTFTHYYHWTALIVTVSIYLGYILSNVLFLHAMRIQSAIHTKAFIAGNAALALTLAAVGVTLAVRVASGDVPESIAFKEKGQSWLRIIGTWAVRVGFVLLFLLFMTAYMRLWFLYDHDEVRLSRILTAHDAEAPPPADAADAAPATAAADDRADAATRGALALLHARRRIRHQCDRRRPPRRGGPAQRRRAVGGVGLTKRSVDVDFSQLMLL